MDRKTLSGRNSLSISFSGSGFLALYQIGAVKALFDLAPDILKSAQMYGSSAGSLIAAAVIFNLDLDKLQKLILDSATEASKNIFGRFLSSFTLITVVRKALLKFLPENAHQLATGRLHVALTRASDGEPILISDFESKEEVIEVLICGCFIPFYCGILPPRFRGVRYFDGALTNFHPFFELKSMITISPFSGRIDICPRDCPVSHLCFQIINTSFQFSVQNMRRVVYALFPPPISVLKRFYFQGYKEAILYLVSNSKINVCIAYPTSDKGFTNPKCAQRRQNKMIGKKPIKLHIKASTFTEKEIQEL